MSFFEWLIEMPWYISAIVLVVGNGIIRYGVPLWFSGERTPGVMGQLLNGGVAQAMPYVANMFTLAIGIVMCFSIIRSLGHKKGRSIIRGRR